MASVGSERAHPPAEGEPAHPPPKSLKFNAAMNLVRVFAAMAFPLITFPYTARILGPDGIGRINFAASFIGYFTLLASIGIPIYGIREVARVRDDRRALSGLVRELLVLHGATSAISFLALLAVIAIHPEIRQESRLFLVVGLSIPLSMLTMDWLYQGLEQYAYITIRSIAFSTLSLGALFLLVHGKDDYILCAGISVLAAFGSSILNFWNSRSIVFAPQDRPMQLRRHLNPLGTLFAFNFIVSLYINLDTVMLGFLSTARHVGYYTSSMKVTRMILALVVSFGSVLLPRLSWSLANGKRDEFDQMLRKSLAVVLLLCTPLTLALITSHREILLILAGDNYLPGASCLVITAPILLFIGLTNILGMQILYPLGQEKYVVISVSAGAVVAVILNALLIPRLAHIGAAWTTLIAEGTVLAVQLVLVRRVYTVRWPWRSIAKYLAAAFLMLFPLLGATWAIPDSRAWSRILLGGTLGTGVYLLVLHLLREELVTEMLARLKGWFARA